MKCKTTLLITVGAALAVAAAVMLKRRPNTKAAAVKRSYIDDREWDEQALLSILPIEDEQR